MAGRIGGGGGEGNHPAPASPLPGSVTVALGSVHRPPGPRGDPGPVPVHAFRHRMDETEPCGPTPIVAVGVGGTARPERVGVGRFRRACVNRPYRAGTSVRHPRGSGRRPWTKSMNRFWIAMVMGPAFPSPTVIRSTLRMGTTSVAVPVKKSSSAV